MVHCGYCTLWMLKGGRIGLSDETLTVWNGAVPGGVVRNDTEGSGEKGRELACVLSTTY